MVRRSVPLLPPIWPLLSSNDTVEPELNHFSHSDLLMPSPSSHTCGIGGLEDIPLTAQTNKLFHYGRVCAHICLVLTKNDKLWGFCASVVTESPALFPPKNLPPKSSFFQHPLHHVAWVKVGHHSVYTFTKLFPSCENFMSKTFQEQLKAASFLALLQCIFEVIQSFWWFYKFKLRDLFNLQRSIQSLTELHSKLSVFVDMKKTISVLNQCTAQSSFHCWRERKRLHEHVMFVWRFSSLCCEHEVISKPVMYPENQQDLYILGVRDG